MLGKFYIVSTLPDSTKSLRCVFVTLYNTATYAWLKDLATQANVNYIEVMTIPRDGKKRRSVSNTRRTPNE